MEKYEKEELSNKLFYLTAENELDADTIRNIKELITQGVQIRERTFDNFFLSRGDILRKLDDNSLIDMAKLFLQHGYEFDYRTFNLAILANNLDFIKWCVKSNMVENAATLALRNCVTYSKLELVDFLLENKANINYYDSTGKTLLTKSLLRNSIEMFKCLVEKGADVNYRAPNLFNEVAYSTFSNYLIAKKVHHLNDLKIDSVEVAEILLKHGYRYFGEDIRSAIITGDVKATEWILEKNLISDSLNELLLLATNTSDCDKNSLDIVEYLINEGANVNYVRKNSNQSPLCNCITHNNVKALKILIKHGLVLNSKTVDSEKLLIIAINNACFDAILCLAENGVKVPKKITEFAERNANSSMWNYAQKKYAKNKHFNPNHYSYFPQAYEEHDFD